MYGNYFNSIKVRLELSIRWRICAIVRFQFHKGTIRTYANKRIKYDSRNFNSIKVRLEQTSSVYTLPGYIHFNSIKVRLELRWVVSCKSQCGFQFHKGTIRTESAALLAVVNVTFQFHKGTIRTQETTTIVIVNLVFQFHKDAIRTRRSFKIPIPISISIP